MKKNDHIIFYFTKTLVLIFLLFPSYSFGLTIDNRSVIPSINTDSVNITCQDELNLIVIYNPDGTHLNLGELFCTSTYTTLSIDSNIFQQLGVYTVVEIDVNMAGTAADFVGSNPTLTSQPIEIDSAYLSQETFTAYSNFSAISESGTISYRPEVNILLPSVGTVFSQDGTIKYEATDKNDTGSKSEKELLGLIENPVSIFYSDKIDEWDNSIIGADLKTPITTGLPATGSYLWKIKGLVPGVFYRIIVDAVDVIGYVGENVSDFFTVDFNAPVFTVKSNPPAVRSGGVTITVDSSEDLAELPKVFVTQRGGKEVSVLMTGEKSHYEGVYEVTSGNDGTAKISVSGVDLAGNTGTDIVGGGTFSVGVDAPPKPIIISPKNDSIALGEFITISGTTREDTTVSLSVNGSEVFETKPGNDGSFTFNNVKLEKTKNYGVNFLSIAAKDQGDALSESSTIKIKFNTAPSISLLNPKEGEILSSLTPINTSSQDENTDPLFFTYQVIPFRDYTSSSTTLDWINIAESISTSRFLWNTTELDDGEYMLRVSASDGISSATTTPIRINIKNTLPFFRFENGRKTVTNKTSVKVVGRVIVPDNLSPRPTISLVEYSVDNGKTWKKIVTENTSTGEKFSVDFGPLSEGTYSVQWRVKDSRGFSNKVIHPILIDTTAPKIPSIISPRNDSLISDDSDEDDKKEGLQISISGTAESGGTLELFLDEKIYTTKVKPDGNFSFKGVTITNRGVHTLKTNIKDTAGNLSKDGLVSFVYNNPPRVTFLHPAPFRGISGFNNGKENVKWKIEDLDKDKIETLSLSYRKGRNPFTVLARNISGTEFLWDVSSLAEGNDYEFKIEVTDGITTAFFTSSFIVDRTSPQILSFSLKEAILGKDDLLEATGKARDTLSGIEFVEYAISGGTFSNNALDSKDWFKAVIGKGFLQNQADFNVKYPFKLDDGKYQFFVRSVDSAGNPSKEDSAEFLVDTIPPRVGSFMALSNNVKVTPDKEGVLSVYKGGEFTFSVSLEGDTKKAEVVLNSNHFELNKEISSGLWQATTTINNIGDVEILLSAEDLVGNQVILKNIGVLHPVSRGEVSYNDGDTIKPLVDVNIEVFVLNDGTGRFSRFKVLDSDLDVKTDSQGTYSLALPTGTYKILIKKEGFKVVEKEITIERSEFISIGFTTEKYSGIKGFFNSIIDWVRY